MAQALSKTPVEAFTAPDDYKTGKAILDGQLPTETVEINIQTNQRADSSTPPELVGERVVAAYHDILYYVDKDNPTGPMPSNPASDPQFNLWEGAVRTWAAKNVSSSLFLDLASTTNSNLHAPENLPTIIIYAPSKNQLITSPELNIQINASSTRGISRTEYYLNGNLWETQSGNLSNLTKNVSFLNNGYQTLLVKSCDNAENCSEAKLDFNLFLKNNPIPASQNTVKISSPLNGTILSKEASLINVRLQVKIPERVFLVKIIAKNTTDNKLIDLGQTDKLTDKTIDISLNNPIPVGSWSLYCELTDWSGQIIKSNEVGLVVK
jgi:hypothetical protein